jgi:hypothetical protein
MDKFARRRLATTAATICTVFIGALVAPGAGATPSQAPTGRDRHALPDLVPAHDRPSHGRVALEMLGDRLPEAARRNGMGAERLREILLEDSSAWLDGDARLLYQEPAHTQHSTSTAPVEAAAAAALDQTFLLHSKPDSRHTIYLDFDGHDVSGTVWTSRYWGVSSGSHPAWSLDGDRATFSTTERAAVQSVWRRVSEDFAPFDVDVTTQDPGAAEITRSSDTDQVYGTRALISPSKNAAGKVCGGGCGGIAYLDVFDKSINHAKYQPAWIFPQSLGDDTKSIAEAVSHEVGHTLGLTHDGVSGGTGYYGGHATWAPIMGVGYSRPITQWSKGDYKGANSHQNDLSVIAGNGLPVRPDEAGGTPSPATPPPPVGSAYITSDADRDIYALGICSGPLSLAARPAAQSPNLDLKLSLLDVTGGPVEVGNPTSKAGTPSRDVATGMDATVSSTVAEDWYFAAVEGVGNGTPSKGYDGYASVGAYTLSVSDSCQTDTSKLPTAPQAVQASTDSSSATVAWSAPASDGGSKITSYVVTRDDAAPVTVPAQSQSQGQSQIQSYTYSDLQPGATDTVAVQAVNSAGEGAPAAVVVKVPATKPGRPRIGSASSGARGGKVTAIARWRAPLSNGGAKVDGFRVYGYRLNDRGTVVQKIRSSVRGPSTSSWQPRLRRGRWKFAVQARNAVGWGPISARSRAVTAR